MKTLGTILGNAERFFAQYLIYLTGKNILWAKSRGYNQYFGKNISQEVVDNAKGIVSLWEGKTLKNYLKNSKKTA